MENFDIPKEYLGNYRKDTLSVIEAGMLCAVAQASKSKDPSTQVGACLIDESGNIVSSGCNSAPSGWPNSTFPWERDVKKLGEENTKYKYVVHAEANCLNNIKLSKSDLSNMTLVVTLFPCCECAKKIIQAGIKQIVYLDDFYSDSKDTVCSKFMLSKCGVKCVAFRDISDILSCNINLDEKEKMDVKKRTRG